MAPTPYFLLGAAPEDTPAADTSAHAVAPDHSNAVARAGLRRQAASGPGRQQGASGSGGVRKTPKRGPGVAELERLRCGGVDPQHDLNSVVLQQHHDYLPAFDAATTNAPYYSIHNLAATMTAARKETAREGFAAAEGRKEVREIEFFPTRVTSHRGPDESELRTTPPSSSSPPGGVGGSLDLSLRL